MVGVFNVDGGVILDVFGVDGAVLGVAELNNAALDKFNVDGVVGVFEADGAVAVGRWCCSSSGLTEIVVDTFGLAGIHAGVSGVNGVAVGVF